MYAARISPLLRSAAVLLLLLLIAPPPADAAPYVVIDSRHVVNISKLPACPFSRWLGEPRYCYECRWCPFRNPSCCEMEDEIDVMKSVQVSGSDAWDCFITIVQLQQCGRCAPGGRDYLQQVDQDKYMLNYVWDPRNLSIRPCRLACEHIYTQCLGAKMLNGNPVIPDSVQSVDDFCSHYPEISTPELPCYNSASLQSLWLTLVVVVLLVLSHLFVF